MTEHNGHDHPEKRVEVTAQDRLRGEILNSALYDWVPLIEVMADIADNHLAEARAAKQDLALRTIRSLLEDGLMMIGPLPGKGEKFTGWDLTIDGVMERLHDRFVDRYDDPVAWEFSIWLGLTEAGELVARELEGQKDEGA